MATSFWAGLRFIKARGEAHITMFVVAPANSTHVYMYRKQHTTNASESLAWKMTSTMVARDRPMQPIILLENALFNAISDENAHAGLDFAIADSSYGETIDSPQRVRMMLGVLEALDFELDTVHYGDLAMGAVGLGTANVPPYRLVRLTKNWGL